MMRYAMGSATRATRDDPLITHRLRALAHVRAACARLEAIAVATDAPDWRDVVAADMLAEVDGLLARIVPP